MKAEEFRKSTTVMIYTKSELKEIDDLMQAFSEHENGELFDRVTKLNIEVALLHAENKQNKELVEYLSEFAYHIDYLAYDIEKDPNFYELQPDRKIEQLERIRLFVERFHPKPVEQASDKCPECGGDLLFSDPTKCATKNCPNVIF